MDKMQYVNLGNTGLKVSRFSYGNWVNCAKDAQETSDKLVKLAFELGINFFDTAEAYGSGEAERQLGKSLKLLNVPRTDYVLATKIFLGKQPDNVNPQNCLGTSRKHLVDGVNRSLKHLDHDYVDVLFCHRYDHTTPVLEVCQAMKTLIDSGKTLYWATSEWPAVRIVEAIYLSDKIGGYRPIADQCQYNLLVREKVEKDYASIFDDYHYGTTIWSPLASGILTGKYNNGIPEGSRFATNAGLVDLVFKRYLGDSVKDATIKKLNELQKIADELGCTLGQLAIAWTLKNKDVSTCILGATSEEQLRQNVAAADFVKKITSEVEARIEAILANAPEQERNWITWQQLPGRRN
jgi:voltage-dependent potassium channel beta subunit